MDGVLYIKGFIKAPTELFDFLVTNVNWDERMAARKTASYGEAYNYHKLVILINSCRANWKSSYET